RALVRKPESRPAATPRAAQATRPHQAAGASPANGNSGPGPNRGGRRQMAVIAAAATGMKLRGFHSNRSSSTASRIAATRVPETAVLPAAEPATSRVLRSAALMLKNWANSEPKAPPVMMIGPSAPNGPPLPMEMADDIGFRTATLGDIRAPPIRIASIASGMP